MVSALAPVKIARSPEGFQRSIERNAGLYGDGAGTRHAQVGIHPRRDLAQWTALPSDGHAREVELGSGIAASLLACMAAAAAVRYGFLPNVGNGLVTITAACLTLPVVYVALLCLVVLVERLAGAAVRGVGSLAAGQTQVYLDGAWATAGRRSRVRVVQQGGSRLQDFQVRIECETGSRGEAGSEERHEKLLQRVLFERDMLDLSRLKTWDVRMPLDIAEDAHASREPELDQDIDELEDAMADGFEESTTNEHRRWRRWQLATEFPNVEPCEPEAVEPSSTVRWRLIVKARVGWLRFQREFRIRVACR